MNATKRFALQGTPRSRLLLRLAQTLLLARAVLGMLLALIYVVMFPPTFSNLASFSLIFVMIAMAVLLIWVRQGLGRGSRRLYWLGAILMAVMLTLASITTNELLVTGSPLGALDLVDLLLPVVVLGLLAAVRKMFGVRW